ncbi:MAG: hypothetical protein MJZ06_04130 [Bacteroidaceae bacterium]|nr:hypothetical protein [Bacteroidaceae bacterium]
MANLNFEDFPLDENTRERIKEHPATWLKMGRDWVELMLRLTNAEGTRQAIEFFYTVITTGEAIKPEDDSAAFWASLIWEKLKRNIVNYYNGRKNGERLQRQEEPKVGTHREADRKAERNPEPTPKPESRPMPPTEPEPPKPRWDDAEDLPF